MTPDAGQRQPGLMRQALSLTPYTVLPAAALYGANALASGGGEDWQRTAANTAGNLAGGLAGAQLGRINPVLGIAGGIAGALGGGYVSDRIADQFQPQQVDAMELLEHHLGQLNPYEKEAALRQQMQQAQMAQREQQRAMREQAMQQYVQRN